MLVLGSPVCKWLLCFAIFYMCSWCLWFSSQWLLYLAIFYACSWCLFLALQNVSCYCALPYFMLAHDACFWLFRKWVPFHISCLLMMPLLGFPDCEYLLPFPYFMPAHVLMHGSWLFRLWVAVLSHFMPAHDACSCSPDCKWSLCLFHMSCSWHLFLTLQRASDCCALLYFMPNHDAWLYREWVAALPCYILCMFMIGYPACEWLSANFHSCLSCLWFSL